MRSSLGTKRCRWLSPSTIACATLPVYALCHVIGRSPVRPDTQGDRHAGTNSTRCVLRALAWLTGSNRRKGACLSPFIWTQALKACPYDTRVSPRHPFIMPQVERHLQLVMDLQSSRPISNRGQLPTRLRSFKALRDHSVQTLETDSTHPAAWEDLNGSLKGLRPPIVRHANSPALIGRL